MKTEDLIPFLSNQPLNPVDTGRSPRTASESSFFARWCKKSSPLEEGIGALARTGRPPHDLMTGRPLPLFFLFCEGLLSRFLGRSGVAVDVSNKGWHAPRRGA